MKNIEIRNALIIEGGAMRGIFTAGVLDAFINNNFYPFDLCFGVSSGAPNVAFYLAGMYQHSYKIYTNYMLSKGFKSWRRFALGGNLLDIDWLWKMQKEGIDTERLFSRKSQLVIVTANARTGEAVYFEPNEANIDIVLKAASTVPIVHRKFPIINGTPLIDGGVGDPLPVKEAYERGARNIMVIRTRAFDYEIKDTMDRAMSAIYLRRNPVLRNAIINKAKLYRKAIHYLRNPKEDANFIEINPPSGFETERLTKDIAILNKDYQLGYQTGERAIERFKNLFLDDKKEEIAD